MIQIATPIRYCTNVLSFYLIMSKTGKNDEEFSLCLMMMNMYPPCVPIKVPAL